MHHQCIALTSSPLLQRQRPIWHLCHTHRNTRPRRCTRAMIFCHGSAKRCLKEVKIAPPNPTILEPIGHGVMSSHTAPSADDTWHWNHTNREFKPWTNWWYCFSTGRGWLMALWIVAEDISKLMLLAIAGSGGQNSWFGNKFQTQTSTKIPLESSDQGLFIGVMKTQWFYCEIILY